MPNHELETDWGVPIPGSWVPEEQRTQTHLQRLPLGVLNNTALFHRQAPWVIDLGCGNGRASILHAIAHPEMDHLAIDIFPGAIRHAVRRANRRGLHNLRFAIADARELLPRLPTQGVNEVHLYHPQPIYDLAAASKRLLTPTFLAQVHRVLVPEGRFLIQTDHPAYWKYLETIMPLFFEWQPTTEPWPDASEGRTRREILARQMGFTIYRAIAKPKSELARETALALAEKLPLPRFDADRRLLELDEREQSEG